MDIYIYIQWKYMFVLRIDQSVLQLYLFACVKNLKLHLAVMSFIHANLIAHGGVGYISVTGCNHCTRRSQARTRRLWKGFLARNTEHGAVLCLQLAFPERRTYMKSSATPFRFIWQPGRSTRDHTYVHARLLHLFSLPSLSRTHGAAAIKGSAGWEQMQLPGSTSLNATVPLRVWVGRSANKRVARWRRRWRLRRGKLQDADLLALDTLRTRAGQVGGFAAPFLGPLGGTEAEAERSGGTLFGCQILGSVLGPQTLPSSRFGPGSSPTLPCVNGRWRCSGWL